MLERISISLDKDLVAAFDASLGAHQYRNRSEALRDLIRQSLIRQEWTSNAEVVGIISLVYDHHQRSLQDKLTHIQHDYQACVISSSHVHIDHHNCLEVVIVRGPAGRLRKMADALISLRGVKDGSLTTSSTGKRLR